MSQSNVSKQCHSLHRDDWMTVSKRKRKESTLWQRRFWEHQISNEQNYQRYIDFNPMNHGLVNRVVDWPHSTSHRYVKDEVYQENWANDGVSVGGDFGE